MKKLRPEAQHRIAVDSIAAIEEILDLIEKLGISPIQQQVLLRVARRDLEAKLDENRTEIARAVIRKMLELLDVVIQEVNCAS